MNNPIFLISTGRTGTKFFSQLFSIHCTDTISHHTSKFTRFLNVAGNATYFGVLPRKATAILWKLLKYNDSSTSPGRYIENNPYYYNYIPLICQLFTDAKIIWVVRHPKSFIQSHIQWERQRAQSRLANCLIPFWQPVAYIDQLRGMLDDDHQRVDFYSKTWQRKNQVILNHLQNTDRYVMIKFEEVFDPARGLDIVKNLLEWLELPVKNSLTKKMFEKKINSSQSLLCSWDEICDRIMISHCGQLMQKLGYDK